jgi:hypothetical protein
MTSTTSTTLQQLGGHHEDKVETMGRVALATQGLLYLIIGVLAIQVATGDRNAEPSQRGALAAVARQPLGKALLVVVMIGLVIHVAWRLVLAARGEPGEDDKKSWAKRAGNVGRAAVYAGFTVAAVKLLMGSGSESGGGGTEKKGTAKALDFPGGKAIVVIAGIIVIGTGLWNIYRGLSRKFEDNLALGGVDEAKRKSVVSAGVIGYVARGFAFGLVGVFLVRAGLHTNPGEAKGLDGALRQVADASYGPWLLGLLAVGLILFGLYRAIGDGRYRKASELTHS